MDQETRNIFNNTYLMSFVAAFLPPEDLKQFRLINTTCEVACHLQLAKTTKVILSDETRKRNPDENDNESPIRLDYFMDAALPKRITPRNFVLGGTTLFSKASKLRLKPFIAKYGNSIRKLSVNVSFEQVRIINLIKTVNQMASLTELHLKVRFPKKWIPCDLENGKWNLHSKNILTVVIGLVERDGCYTYSDDKDKKSCYKNLVEIIFKYFPSKILRYNSPKNPARFRWDGYDFPSYREDIPFFQACRPFMAAGENQLIFDYCGRISYDGDGDHAQRLMESFEKNYISPPSLQLRVNHFVSGRKNFDLTTALAYHASSLRNLDVYFYSINNHHFDNRKYFFVLPERMLALRKLAITLAYCDEFEENPKRIRIPHMDYAKRFPSLEELEIDAPVFMLNELYHRFTMSDIPCNSLKKFVLNPQSGVFPEPGTGSEERFKANLKKVFPNLIWVNNGSGERRWT